MERIIAVLGMAVILGTAVLFSNNRRAINWKTVASGLGLQFLLALLILRVPGTRDAFYALGQGVEHLLGYAVDGAAFVVGDQLAHGPFIFAIRVGASIIFVAALSSLAYYLGIMQRIVNFMARMLSKSLGITGPEAVSTSAAVFVGQVECQMLIKPYLPKLSSSQLFCSLTAAMATISGSALVAYTAMGMNPTHLIAASIMSAVGGIVMAKIFFPETDKKVLEGHVEMAELSKPANAFDAIAIGAQDGWRICQNVMVMVMVGVAMVALMNGILSASLSTLGVLLTVLTIAALIGLTMRGRIISLISGWRARFGLPCTIGLTLVSTTIAVTAAAMLASGLSYFGVAFTVQDIFGVFFTPIAFLMGVPSHEAFHVGKLMATEILVNEYASYGELSKVIAGTGGYALAEKTQMIATMALCGFANLSSIAINIGGLGAMAPERRSEVARVAFRALIAANFATWMTAAMAGLIF
jgi:CNT family concentrative nucleoside transporter